MLSKLSRKNTVHISVSLDEIQYKLSATRKGVKKMLFCSKIQIKFLEEKMIQTRANATYGTRD